MKIAVTEKLRRCSLLLIPGLLLLFMAGCEQASTLFDVEPGEPFPRFRLQGLDDTALTTDWALQQDRPVVVNFWATWCGPCVREIPVLNRIQASNEVTVIAVSLDEAGAQEIKAFVKEHDILYPVAVDGMSLFKRLGGRVVPYTLVLDADLRVVSSHQGLVTHHTLERDLSKAMSSRNSG